MSTGQDAAPYLSTPMSEPESPSALADLSRAAERLSITSKALLIARHDHDDASRDFAAAFDRVQKIRETEAT